MLYSCACTPLLLLCYHKEAHTQWGTLLVFSICRCHFFAHPTAHYLHFFIIPCSVLHSFLARNFSHLSELLLLFFHLSPLGVCLIFASRFGVLSSDLLFFVYSSCIPVIPVFCVFLMESFSILLPWRKILFSTQRLEHFLLQNVQDAMSAWTE